MAESFLAAGAVTSGRPPVSTGRSSGAGIGAGASEATPPEESVEAAAAGTMAVREGTGAGPVACARGSSAAAKPLDAGAAGAALSGPRLPATARGCAGIAGASLAWRLAATPE